MFATAGPLSSKLSVAHLLEEGLLDLVLPAFVLLKQQQLEADSSIQTCDDFVTLLLGRVLQDFTDISTDDKPPWVEAAAQTYLLCIGEKDLQLSAVMLYVHMWYRLHRHRHALHGYQRELYVPCRTSCTALILY